MKALFVTCFVLSLFAGSSSSACLTDASGKCLPDQETSLDQKLLSEAADVNELMQRRIHIGSSISPEEVATLKTSETVNLDVAAEPKQETCKVDHFGLIESAGPDEPWKKEEENDDISFADFSDLEFSGEEYAENLELESYFDEPALLEQQLRAELEADQQLDDADDEEEYDVEERHMSTEDLAFEMVHKAVKEQTGASPNLKMTDLPSPPAILQERQSQVQHHHISSGANVATEVIFEKRNCRKNKKWLGKYDRNQCAEKVFDMGYTYFQTSMKPGVKYCEVLMTAKPDCPKDFTFNKDMATIRVYEVDKPSIFSMYPQQGSIAGGQLVTFLGAYLKEPHAEIEGQKDTASALRAPFQIFFMWADQGRNVSLECPMENFESRTSELKCVTPELKEENMFLADVKLHIAIFKLSATGSQEVSRPRASDIDQVLYYKYSSTATPELSSVSPVSAGPGDIITIQAFSCSGIVEGDPIELVKIVPKTVTVHKNDTADAESTELVPDPETAYGHICERWPPMPGARLSSGDKKQVIMDDENGAIGLDALMWKLDERVIPPKLEQWVKKQNIGQAARWIQPKPFLKTSHYWLNKKLPYVAKLSGRVKIDRAGEYIITMHTMKQGYMKIDGVLQRGTSKNKGTKAQWGSWGKLVVKKQLSKGMYRVEFVHAADMTNPYYSNLEVWYYGPDTGYEWMVIPDHKLRAGISREEVAKHEESRSAMLNHQEKYLVPAKEIFESRAKGIGSGHCPSLPNVQAPKFPKLVEFKCKISDDMEPGFYDVKFKDHEFGESITPIKVQWLSSDMTHVTMRVVPVITNVKEYSDGEILVEGNGLDGLQDSDVTFNGYKYEILNSTQDFIQLLKGPFLNDTAIKMGARGLLREYWFADAYPEELEGRGENPMWQRGSKLKTDIMVKPEKEANGFSERLTGLLVPPFSGECRWRMKGTLGANSAKLFFNEAPLSEQSEVVQAPTKVGLAMPDFVYAGREFWGNEDYEDLASLYKGSVLGGAMSIAFTSKFENVKGASQRVMDFGNGAGKDNIIITRAGSSRHMAFEIYVNGQGRKAALAENMIKLGSTQNWLATVSAEGTMRIFREGVLVGQCLHCNVADKIARKNMYVAKSNWEGNKNLIGSVKDLRFYSRVVRWEEAFAESGNKAVKFKLVRYDAQCQSRAGKNLDWQSNVIECAEEAEKSGFKYFSFGKMKNYGYCYGETRSACSKFTEALKKYDVYKVVPADSTTAKTIETLPFPAEPAVVITDNNEQASSYMTLQEGLAYPLKLERHVAMRTQDTGPSGWSKLGLECRQINSSDAPELSGALLPKASYQVQMTMKEYFVTVTLPNSTQGYDITFKGHQESVAPGEAAANLQFLSIFGPKCTVTKSGGSLQRQEFSTGFDDSSDSACGSSRMKAPLNARGIWKTSTVRLMQAQYKLKDMKYLHMCYKIAQFARINMLVKCKVGAKKRTQWFSVGMTDGIDKPDLFFHKDRKRAAQWNIKTDNVNKTTTNTWECTSLDLFSTVMAWDSYERRFDDIRYDFELTNPGDPSAPARQLQDMEILEIYLGTARYQDGRWLPLEGESFVDTLVASSDKFEISRQPFYQGPLPWASVSVSGEVKFKPFSRSKIAGLKAFLDEVQFSPKTGGVALGNKVSYSPSFPPPEMMKVKAPMGTISWKEAVMVTWQEMDAIVKTDVGRQSFNAMFRQCPVVKYIHNDLVHSIYLRTSTIPANFDAYDLFTRTWKSINNELNVDFKLYAKEGDLALDRNPWKHCNYDASGIGYPRDCGQDKLKRGAYFRFPDHGGAMGAFAAYGFMIQTENCASPQGTAYIPPKEASFQLNDTSAAISHAIKSVGVPEVETTSQDAQGIKWLDMTDMTAVQSSTYSDRVASRAIDGRPSAIAWNAKSCSCTNREKLPWWSVNLGGTVKIEKVRVTARDSSSQIEGAVISVDGKPCHKNLKVANGEVKEVLCIATGSTLAIHLPRKNGRDPYLNICEVEVGTFDGVQQQVFTSGSDAFSFRMEYTKASGHVPAPLFGSDLAADIKVITVSSGTRFFPDITDAYFRMPHDVAQLSFDPWNSYICNTGSSKGCAPVSVPTQPGNTTNKTSLLQRDAIMRVTTHTRRHPQRKWRLSPRFHNEESLEKLRRRVFGFAKAAFGWKDTATLLQIHAGKQKHFSTADPRKDPQMMRWSAKSSWGGEAPPNGNTTDIVYIPEGKTALLDMNVNIRFWVIEGNVVWDQTKDIHMEGEAIVVNGGQLLIGSEEEPYAKLGKITLHGNWHDFKLPLCGAKTIFQTRGNIEMHGTPIATTWSQLDITAVPGEQRITVQGKLDWKPGNQIVIAASDATVTDCRLDRRDSCQVEELYIAKIEDGPNSFSEIGGPTTIIYLDRPLKYRHLAEEYDSRLPQKYCVAADDASCAMTQVRSEVGLLTRNIVVKGANHVDGSGPPGSEGFGGHLMHAEKAKYSYVEFFWMGQAFQMGRYPLHLHLTGFNPTSYIKGCALHRTFMRGITVHGTHSATIKDNVLYNTMAHGYFIEDGDEHNNVFENNLGIMVHKSLSVLVSDQTPAVFWIRNPSNYFRNNHAAGGAAFGFWFDTLGVAAKLGIKQFENNTAHSNGNTGIWIDIVDPRDGCTASNAWTIKVPARDSDAVSHPVHDNAPNCATASRSINKLLHTTTWGNGEFGITLFETGHLHVINHRSVQDKNGILVWGIQSDDWPDPTNNFNGPSLLHSVYSSISDLPDHLPTSCSIGGPWDDTLLVYGAQFIGPVSKGHFCPCFECLQEEGGYETRTGKLGWHAGAGTESSPRASWPWMYATNFFDFDGTLTEDTADCRLHGCYLHPPFAGEHAGMYSRRDPDSFKGNAGDNSGGEKLIQESDHEDRFLESADDQDSSAQSEDADEDDYDPESFIQVSEARSLVECKKPLSDMISDDKITASSYYKNQPKYGRGEMWRAKINFESDPSWVAWTSSPDTYIEYDLGRPTWVTGIQTQGRKGSDQWITKYQVQYTTDGKKWIVLDKTFEGNRDRSRIQENRIAPIKATKVRLYTTSCHNRCSARVDFLGCSGSLPLTMTCIDKPYLSTSKKSCSELERELGPKNMQDFCKSDKGAMAMYTELSAQQACCACGGGASVVAQNATEVPENATTEVPENASVKVIPGGTGYFDPSICHVVDATGGIVCRRSARINSITVKNAGLWHAMLPIEVQSDFGFATMTYVNCYSQYEFTVMSGNRYTIIPPYSPKMLVDWDLFDAEVKLSAGDKFVLQWETIHNPDGYTVTMENVEKSSTCDRAEMQYGDAFKKNHTLIDILKKETDMHSVQKLKLSQGYIFDMYKVAHIPLLERAGEATSAGMWGYIQANESLDFRYWYPGMFNALVTEKGVSYASNSFGPWDGYKKNPLENWPTRNVNSRSSGAAFGFSQIKTPFHWKRLDGGDPGQQKGGTGDTGEVPPIVPTTSRLEFLVKNCGFNPASLAHHSQDAYDKAKNHQDVVNGSLKVEAVRRFKWSEWPTDLGGKPTRGNGSEGFGNVSIEANWEITLDEDVDFLNKLNISGVLKFEDKPGCCKLVARYIFVGPLFGKIQAGTEADPISQGIAHIVLKGQPMTPPLKHFRPHIFGSAKFLKSKFLAVQGSLLLHGATRSKTWVRIAKGVQPDDSYIEVEGGDFKPGDVIAIDHGVETKTVKSVTGGASSATTRLILDSPVKNSYRGADHIYNSRQETKGWMAGHVGLVDGYRVIVEGEDTPGLPMCHKSATQRCPYANGLGAGMNLHDFAKEMRKYLEKTGAANHPNCRPCGAVSEMGFAGFVIGMAHLHYHKTCPKDHGVIDVTGVVFKHGSNMRLYHPFTGGNFPDDVDSYYFASVWNSRPHAWWEDPVWAELNVQKPPVPRHQIKKSAFNNTLCGAAFALANAGLQVFPTAPVTDNVILGSAVGYNGAARRMADIDAYTLDTSGTKNDNFNTITQGVGNAAEFGAFGSKYKYSQGWSNFKFTRNMLINSVFVFLKGGGGLRQATDNVINGPVYMDGCPTSAGSTCFANNVINSPASSSCIDLRSSGTHGIADNTVFGCRIAIAFNWQATRESTVRRMKILDSEVGIHYFGEAANSQRHDARREEFLVTDVALYAKPDGSGTGIRNPKVHVDTLGEPSPDWWHAGPNFFPMGHSAPCLFFKSKLQSMTFVGYNQAAGGVAITVGYGHQGDTGDADYHPVFTRDLKFEGKTSRNSYLSFAQPAGFGLDIKQCLQIDCDGRRNSLVVDEDGTLIGSPGTVISPPHRFYAKLKYVDPFGLATMEDLIPMPARYDAVGNAIPFPSGVPHGQGGGLEYKCNTKAGCEVLYMQRHGSDAGKWLPNPLQTLAFKEKIVAVREDSGYIFLDALYHGWDLALGAVKTAQCKKTMDPSDTSKPESQHARRYGRVAVGAFGTHLNASKIPATKGPVYTTPGIYRKGCTFNAAWRSYECPKGRHRHLLIEVMDWNHMVRRWAPVSVEVNDNYAPQGGVMNILTGPAMYWTAPSMRLQSFHALGHVGLRHNVYFSADPPSHLRLHLQYANKQEGVIVCVYYGLPNLIQAYVGGAKKAPLIIPSWDNLVFAHLNTSMEHGTYFYDRIGVETLRPGYLYAMIKGDQHVDFKISHKIVLTSKVQVTAGWGGWKDDKLANGTDNKGNDNFFKRGINGLVRNIALLIGAPPSRVAILGAGKAKKGTFWNEQTTNTKFAEWMWTQNKSMDQKSMKEWATTPGAKLKKVSNASLADMSHHHGDFLQKFSEGSRSIAAEALVQEGPGADTWHHKLSLLSTEEQSMIQERRVSDMLEAQGEAHYQALRFLQERVQSASEDDSEDEVSIIVDTESKIVPPTIDCSTTDMKDCMTLEQHDYHQTQLGTEADGMKLLEKCVPNGTSACTLPSDNVTADVQQVTTDNVPTKNNPLGWNCDLSAYNDGLVCDCDCGIWDPDCDLSESSLSPAFLNSTDQIVMLDQEQATAAVKSVDKNFNSVIDADEVSLIPKLGASALYSVAETIRRVQEAGENVKGTLRRGNFAWMESVVASSCNKLLEDAPLSSNLAKYTPRCVKDTIFDLRLTQPTGRCALQPKMEIGSQCLVPGGGFYPSPPRGVNQTSDHSVCGAIVRIFRGGLGMGGKLGAGVGPSSAQWFHPGGNIVPWAAGALPPINMKVVKKGLNKLIEPGSLKNSFKNGMSFYARIKFNSWRPWSRIFSFYSRPWISGGPQWGTLEAMINSGKEKHEYDSKKSIFFGDKNRWAGRRRTTRYSHLTTQPVPIQEEMQLLFTRNKNRLEVWKNGRPLSSTPNYHVDEWDMTPDFDKMDLWIGRDYQKDRYVLDADIRDIRIWNRVVTWDVAVQGVPASMEPPAAAREDEDPEEVDVPCISSKLNTWDLACQDELSEEEAYQLGIDEWSAKEEFDKFDKRAQMGDITICTAKASTKGVVFAGKFGDGLTAEYYRMRTSCSSPPFIFGVMPAVVRVDPEVKVPSDFVAPQNQYAILWGGKVLIHTAGSYQFEMEVNDGAWLAIDSHLRIGAGGCTSGSKTQTKTSEPTTLSSGGHHIAILYFNRGPAGSSQDAKIVLKYKGPDTANNMVTVPTTNLGSDPLRLATMSKDTTDKENTTNVTVSPFGKFVYDEEDNVAIMPKGSCDLRCQRGQRKTSAAQFRFFCKTSAEVSFVAEVSDHSQHAMMWYDQSEEAEPWVLKSSTALVQKAAVQANASMSNEMRFHHSLGVGTFKHSQKNGQDYQLGWSSESKSKAMLRGTHTLFFQGLPADNEIFALKYLEFVKGKDVCQFYLEGKDTYFDQC